MVIYQIAIGRIPEYLEHCTRSVSDYAKRNGYDLSVITEIPEQYKDTPSWPTSHNSEYFRNRLIKDFITFDLLTTMRRVLIVDWDVYLYRKFSFDAGRMPVFAVFPFDCIMYNGDDLDSFVKMRDVVGDLSKLKPGALTLNIGFAKYNTFKYKNFNQDLYHHFLNSQAIS